MELEFTSERARMSVVARAPDGTIRLLTKGSDAVRFSLCTQAPAQILLTRKYAQSTQKYASAFDGTICLVIKGWPSP